LFEGKSKLMSLPLKPIFVEAPFQHWGLDFIGEIHWASLTQHRSILIGIDYFTNLIEALSSRKYINLVVIQFLDKLFLDLVA